MVNHPVYNYKYRRCTGTKHSGVNHALPLISVLFKRTDNYNPASYTFGRRKYVSGAFAGEIAFHTRSLLTHARNPVRESVNVNGFRMRHGCSKFHERIKGDENRFSKSNRRLYCQNSFFSG